MSSYTIHSKRLNKDRVFILQQSELEKRWDPFFYVPELLELEQKVAAKSPKKLRDYVVGISSGSTPKTTESDKYYADKETGIPFLRVQNLSPSGVLEFDNCKYINEETHERLLKRSQVREGDLLVKITGVGRMAVASVAPPGFEGNINQHVCVIRTKSREISETVAAFLNSDIGERLASRRSTGGTRPALDYSALLSIPVIEDDRLSEIAETIAATKQQADAEAERLLAGIDDYLLGELGIVLPPPPANTLKERMFETSLNTISGGRFDPFYYQKEFLRVSSTINSSKFKIQALGHLIFDLNNGAELREYVNEGTRYLRVTDLGKNGLNSKSPKFIDSSIQVPNRIKLNTSCILVSRSGSLGLVNVVEESIEDAILSSHIFKLELNTNLVLPVYLEAFLRSSIGQVQIFRNNNGGVIPEINQAALKSIEVVVPPPSKQEEIAAHISGIRQQAQALKAETASVIAAAKVEIEKIILG